MTDEQPDTAPETSKAPIDWDRWEQRSGDAEQSDRAPQAVRPARASTASTRSRSRVVNRERSAGWFGALPPGGRIALIAGAAVAALLVVLIGVDLAFSAGRIHPGVSVSGVDVGSMTPADARKRLEAQLAPRMTHPVTVRSRTSKWDVAAAKVGASLDVDGSVRVAEAVGHEASPWAAFTSRVKAWVSGLDVAAKVDLDAAKAAAFFDEVDGAVGRQPTNARIVIDGTSASLVSATTGIGVKRSEAAVGLQRTFAAATRTLTLVLGPVKPDITDADTTQALADARAMLSGPVTVLWEQKSWTFQPSEITHWIVFRSVDPAAATATATASAGASSHAGVASNTTTASATGANLVLQAEFSPDEVGSTMKPLTAGIGRPAVEAQFVVVGGRVTVTGGKPGLGPDYVTLASELAQATRPGGSRQATLQLATLQPTLTAEKASAMGIVERISTYTTQYSSGAAQRVSNIHTLAKALNNRLVPPGGVFDFNATVGERTAAKGYKEAPAIVGGKLVPQLGGGICQIGTTFFNSVFFSGLPVLERTNHSFYISHYPKGRDCTVSWGGPNFRWKNDTAQWILIRTSFSDSDVTISLYGTNPGYKVAYTTSAFTNIRPFPIKEIKDPTLPVGAKIISATGVDGRSCTVVRTVTKDGQAVRTDRFTSDYSPAAQEVRVGTKAKSVSKPATSTPTP